MSVKVLLTALAVYALRVTDVSAGFPWSDVDCGRTYPPLTPIEECMCEAEGNFGWWPTAGVTGAGVLTGAKVGGVYGAIIGGLTGGTLWGTGEMKALDKAYEDCQKLAK